MLLDDLRHALRAVRRRPGFLMLGVVALGLGLAGSALVLSLANTFLLRPVSGMLPSAPLVEIGRVSGDGGFDTFSYPDFVDVRERSRTFDRVVAWRGAIAYLQATDEAHQVMAQLVSGDFFEALGVRPAQGVLIGPPHDRDAGADPVVVASHAAFVRWFGADPRMIGRDIRINGRSLRLIGVADPGFRGHQTVFVPDFFVPLSMAGALHVQADSNRSARGSRWLQLAGRLAPGANLDQARAELHALGRNIEAAHPESNEAVGFDLAPLRPVPHASWQIIAAMSTALFVLCSVVVLLACVNLAGVMLAQGEARRGEFAMRAALGAGRGRLVRQLLFESVLIGAAAGLFGLALAWAGRDLLNVLPLPLPVRPDLSLAVDANVALATMGLALLVSIVFGLRPALRLSANVRGGVSLREAGEQRAPRQRGRRLFIAVQATLTVALLLFAASLLRAVDVAASIDTGFGLGNVWLAPLDVEPLGIEADRGAEHIERLAERLRAVPGVDAAGFASLVPLGMSSMSFGRVWLPGSAGEGDRLDVNTVGEGFFDAVSLPVRGRAILRSDAADGERVAVVNRAFAQRLFGDDDALGRSFELGSHDDRTRVTVVGVVPDGRYANLAESGRSFAFLAAPQWPRGEFTMFVRSSLPAPVLRDLMRSQVDALLPGMPLPRLQAFEAAARLSIVPQTLLGGAASILGLLALALAATGLYGVIALQIVHRRREFGVRMALGAVGARIAVQVAGGLAVWLLAGALLGASLGQGAVMVAGSQMAGLEGFDAVALMFVLSVFALASAVATAAPLARVLRLRPADALRAQ